MWTWTYMNMNTNKYPIMIMDIFCLFTQFDRDHKHPSYYLCRLRQYSPPATNCNRTLGFFTEPNSWYIDLIKKRVTKDKYIFTCIRIYNRSKEIATAIRSINHFPVVCLQIEKFSSSGFRIANGVEF